MFGECRISYPEDDVRVQFCAHRHNPIGARRGRLLLTISGEVSLIKHYMDGFAEDMEDRDPNEAVIRFTETCAQDDRVVVAVTPRLKQYLENGAG